MKLFSQLAIVLTIITCNISSGENLFTVSGHRSDILTKQEADLLLERGLDSSHSDRKLGSFFENGQTCFRLFAPQAEAVSLCTFRNPEDQTPDIISMKKNNDGIWETRLDGHREGLLYAYRVWGKNEDLSFKAKPFCVDPYAKAVATMNTYMSPRLSLVHERPYDWEGDKGIRRDWRDLCIYEMHVRDITADPSSGAARPGTYMALTEHGTKGGLDYIKSLGVNTVELMPSQEFANIEIPYKDSLAGRFNTWNPYERNHWGYMTSNYFAPAAYYAQEWKGLKFNEWMGEDGTQVEKFKDMVKAFHKEGIAVIMDVVYNHLSEYEQGNLKQIDKDYYFRLDRQGHFIAESGCGNDLKSENPMVRNLIVESILFWMKEYHIDGFRFDLAKILDWGTIEEIIKEARKLNPDVVIVCEPWGGGYDPVGFSLRGWGAWNDQIRNGIKGENPNNGLGWIFGRFQGNNSIGRIKSYVQGTLIRDSLGIFQKKEHSVNYLESHDGLTLGDFIRIGTGEVKPSEIVRDRIQEGTLNPKEMRLNKLAAAFLLSSQGICMISSGQEFARSKVVPFDNKNDQKCGQIDDNSYNKDNAANYIDYGFAERNSELLDYYRGLFKIRNHYQAFRRAEYHDIKFIETGNDLSLGYILSYKGEKFCVLFNANQESPFSFSLPEGKWDILLNDKSAGLSPLGFSERKVQLPAVSAMILHFRH